MEGTFMRNDDDNHITTTDSNVTMPMTWRRRAGDRGPIVAVLERLLRRGCRWNGLLLFVVGQNIYCILAYLPITASDCLIG